MKPHLTELKNIYISRHRDGSGFVFSCSGVFLDVKEETLLTGEEFHVR